MSNWLRQYRILIILLVCTLLLNALSAQPVIIEKWYTYGIYQNLSKGMRLLFGWLPFSAGDILYAAAVLGLLLFIGRVINTVRRKGANGSWLPLFNTISYTLILIYIVFQVLWGLNYSRLGISHQLKIEVKNYELDEVRHLTQNLQERLNALAVRVDTTKRKELHYNTKLFQKAIVSYDKSATIYPYLQYSIPSLKPSLYSRIGHYIGFTGYYNPFSGEAQVKTSLPIFLKPFVANHEIAHQLGYAKENEANFVAFLTARESKDVDFLYSVYYNLYRYALREVYSRDSIVAIGFRKSLHPQVIRDNEELKAYFISTQNNIEPLFTRFYDQFLKFNKQKEGVQTYNEVVALLIGYARKYGWQAI